MKVAIGTIWRCIDEDSESYRRLCVIKDIDNNPDYNGEGVIELLYADGSKHYGKVRRFIPGLTHEFVGKSKKSSF